MLATDPRTLLDLHHQHVAELRAQSAADGLARAVRAGRRARRSRRRRTLLGVFRRARLTG